MTTNEGHEYDSTTPTPRPSADDAVLQMLAGANFGPGAKIILPSGAVLGSDEAQAFTAAFARE